MGYEIENLRNFCLVGHGGVGKTSLCEAILFKSGAVSRLGRVEEGNSIMDYDPEEIERKISISLALAWFEWGGKFFNVIDTPGYADFSSDVVAGVRVADGVVVLVDSTSGVEVGTERVWQYADGEKLPRLVFVSKLKKEQADFFGTLKSCRESFGERLTPLVLPIGSGDKFEGLVDLLNMKAVRYRDGKADEGDVPAELKDTAEEFRERLVEAVVETDDQLMERYLGDEQISPEEFSAALRKAVISGKVVPLLGGDGHQGVGIEMLLCSIAGYLPSPAERGPVKGTGVSPSDEVERRPQDPFCGLVFKTAVEPHVGELSYLRVFSGSLEPGSEVLNASSGKSEKVNQIYLLRGKDRGEVKELPVGWYGALVKLRGTKTGDTLTAEGHPILLTPIQFPSASASIAISPKTKGDEEKVSSALARLHYEDPSFSWTYDAELRQTLIWGLGELHLEVMVNKLRRKFGVEVELKKPKIPYRETITKTREAQGKYKRQSGGRGQYGDVWMKLEPLPRGEGFEFVDKIVGGVIPSKYVPAVEKGIKEALASGVLAGYPAVDLRATLYDGSYHPVDSSDIAFKIAGSLGFKNAAEKAGPILLEPIMQVEVMCPEEMMGEVIGDLNSRRGKIQGMERVGRHQRIRALVPQAEMYKYSSQLRSITQDRGSFTQKFVRYAEMPKEMADRIVSEAKKEE